MFRFDNQTSVKAGQLLLSSAHNSQARGPRGRGERAPLGVQVELQCVASFIGGNKLELCGGVEPVTSKLNQCLRLGFRRLSFRRLWQVPAPFTTPPLSSISPSPTMCAPSLPPSLFPPLPPPPNLSLSQSVLLLHYTYTSLLTCLQFFSFQGLAPVGRCKNVGAFDWVRCRKVIED